MKKRIYFVVVFALLAGLVIAVWLPQPTLGQTTTPKPKATPPQTGEIRVGFNFSLSGSRAMWGIAYSRTINTFVEQINKEGGLLVGGKRYSIKLFEYDNKDDPALSVENAKRLIFTDKVHTIVHFGGVVVSPTLPILSENKIVSMDMSVGPYVLRWPYNFVMQPAGSFSSTTIYKTFIKLFGIKKVAEINPDNDSGYTTEVDDRRVVKQLGVEMISHQFFPEDTTDFYPILTKAIAAKPDIIIIGMGNPGNTPVIVKQARELGWKGPMGGVQGSIGSESTMLKIAGEATEGFVHTTPTHSDRNFYSKQENEWMDYWLKRWGEPFPTDTYLSCRAFNLWVQGVKKANSLDPDKIAKALETGDFVVQGWRIHFGVTPDTYMGRARSLRFPLPVQVIKGGKNTVMELVLPEGVVKAQ
jgi:branched-chain amino acid transport system substrate-binding protein